jgi:hypothetical protein
MVVQDVEPIAGDRLLHCEALEVLRDVSLGDGAGVVAVFVGIKSTFGRKLLQWTYG